MRASDLLGAGVRDADGANLGHVSDIRVVQDGPVLGTWGAAFRVTGLVVSPNHTGSFLGYERGSVRGPWLVATIVKWLHRDAVLVPWEDVESWADRCVRVRRRRAELPPVPPLD
jgi:sporulation protein YlmC with PRC-barrel domain